VFDLDPTGGPLLRIDDDALVPLRDRPRREQHVHHLLGSRVDAGLVPDAVNRREKPTIEKQRVVTKPGSAECSSNAADQDFGPSDTSACQQCTNAHRVLKGHGTVAPNFIRSNRGDDGDPVEMLRAEGALVNGKPDPARELSSDDLQVLIEQ
jgi:hypothetical protein